MSSNSYSFEEDIIEEKPYSTNPSYYVKRMKKKKERFSQFLENSNDKYSKNLKKTKTTKDPFKKSFMIQNILKMATTVINSIAFQILFSFLFLGVLIISSYKNQKLPREFSFFIFF